MARYENLPIYRKAVELVVYLEKAVRDFPRYHKYAVGADLRNLARELAVLIIAANSRRDKVPVLTRLRDKSEEMKLMVMIAKEVQSFRNFKQFQQAAGLAVEISRQSEGWLGSRRGHKGPEPSNAISTFGGRVHDHCAPAPPHPRGGA